MKLLAVSSSKKLVGITGIADRRANEVEFKGGLGEFECQLEQEMWLFAAL
jgi:hypothetical protein